MARRCAALFVVVLLAPACLPKGLAFVKKDTLVVVEPKSHSTVTTPVTIRWRPNGFDVTGPDGRSRRDAGYFGVFVDRAPVPAGKPLQWIAHTDRICRARPGCPDTTYLADHDTYGTADTSLLLETLPDQNAYRGREHHEVAIVLLDGRGRRIGEAAWFVDFSYHRPK